jgi:aminobenzoyl-glutamate utilization protein B
MTETSVRSEVISGDANLVGNVPLEELMFANLQRLGPPVFDDADRDTARKFQATMSAEDIASSYARFGLKPKKDQPLCEEIFPLYAGDSTIVGSTDVGSVSWVVPTVQMRGATYAIGTPGHSWQLVAQGKLPAAHKGTEHAAKVMASTAIALISNPALIKAAKADLQARLDGSLLCLRLPWHAAARTDLPDLLRPRPVSGRAPQHFLAVSTRRLLVCGIGADDEHCGLCKRNYPWWSALGSVRPD